MGQRQEGKPKRETKVEDLPTIPGSPGVSPRFRASRVIRRIEPDPTRPAGATADLEFGSQAGSVPQLERHVEESVRKQLEHFQSELQALIQSPETTSQQLAQAYGRMGKLYHTYDLLEAGEACYRNALQLAPQDFRWPYYLALLYEGQGDLEKAGSHYQQASNLQANDLAAVLGLARVELDRGRPEVAQRRFERALELDPRAAAALVGLGEIAVAGRDFEKAVDRYEEALKLQPKASNIHYPLAMAYRQLGKVDKARLHLSKKGDGPVTYSDPLVEELVKAKTGRWQQRQQANSLFDAGKHEQAARIFRQSGHGRPDGWACTHGSGDLPGPVGPG